MKKLGLILFASAIFAACNNTADETKTTDSTNVQNNTSVAPMAPDSNMSTTIDSNKMRTDTMMRKDSNRKRK